MKKKKYIREGGICQFFDKWSKDGVHIEGQKLVEAIFSKKVGNNEDYYFSNIPSCKNSYTNKETDEEKQMSFNHNYKIYGKED